MTEHGNLTDHFLLAMPALDDPNFSQSVTYICEHNEDGAMGVVINRPLDIQLKEILLQLDIEVRQSPQHEQPVYAGGPVLTDRGFVLHQPAGQWESSLKIADDIALTTSRDILDAIARGNGPEHYLLALGYAGWGAGQLEEEMKENAWLTIAAEHALIFNNEPATRWRRAAELIGIDPSHLSDRAGHA